MNEERLTSLLCVTMRVWAHVPPTDSYYFESEANGYSKIAFYGINFETICLETNSLKPEANVILNKATQHWL